ncbi:hypothetical protein [Plesiomonas shigelloides]|uniref:hypothetical protein n=1 Tax=Plesiomonas shigelloides TaxID=703 RepID=UPI001261EC1C|nr:hypothetical protein [Plesiomonas shigelloides]KAB7693117.1 hypothetical protein GBN20_00930 [Plesiomonas shigelloides]
MTTGNVTLKVVDPTSLPEYQNLKDLEQSVEAISELSDAFAGTDYYNLLQILSERLTSSFERVYVDSVQHLNS